MTRTRLMGAALGVAVAVAVVVTWLLVGGSVLTGRGAGGLGIAATVSLRLVIVLLALRQARKTPEERWLWRGVAASCALMSLAAPLRASLFGVDADAHVLLLCGAAAVLALVASLLQHVGIHAWLYGHARSGHRAETAAAVARVSSAPRSLDRHEVLVGLALVLLPLALLNAAAVLVVGGAPHLPAAAGGATATGAVTVTAGTVVPPWLGWAVLQPALAVVAAAVARAVAVPAVASARHVQGDRRFHLLVLSAVLTVAAGVVELRSGGPLVWAGAGHPGSWLALCEAAALLPLVVGTALRPNRTGRQPHVTRSTATVGAAGVLVVGVLVLAGGAVSDTVVDVRALTSWQRPFGAAAIVLALVVVCLAATRLVMNVRQLRWSLASDRESVTDDLTGLLNRRGLLRRLESACSDGGPIAMALVDVDHFGAVNDGLGHAAGDELLRQVAERLTGSGTTFSYERVIARLGGDEFVVLVLPRDQDTPAHVRADHAAALTDWGTMLQWVFEDPFEVGGTSVHATASIGLTSLDPSSAHRRASSVAYGASAPTVDDAARTPTELLRRVDSATHRAKQDTQRGQAVLYDPSLHDDAARRLQTVTELRHGLESGQLQLRYQPQVDAATGRASGAEALVRWVHPERGIVPPDHFLPLAEAHGLMGRLTEVVLEQAVRQVAAWRSASSVAATAAAGLRVSVNLSATNLIDTQLPALVAGLLHAHAVPPSALVLEVTETVLLRDPERARAVVAALAELGIELSIDDFGVGYSSLTQLHTLPVSELKLDRAFTSGLDTDARAAHIVASTVSLAHGLGLRVVAEGVEDDVTLEHLHRLGCDVTQGYLHARPCTPEELLEWLDRFPAAVPAP